MFEDYNADYLRRQGNDVARKYYDWNTQIDEIDAFRHIYINALLRTRHSDKYVKFAGNFQEWITNEADPYHNKGYYNNAIGLSLVRRLGFNPTSKGRKSKIELKKTA